MSATNTTTTQEGEYDKSLEERNIQIAKRTQLERSIRIVEAAKKAMEQDKGKFIIRLKMPTGNKVINAFGQQEDEYHEGQHEKEPYHFRRISTSDWNLYRTKLAELNNETAKPIGEADNTKVVDLNNRIYEFLALKYLGIKHPEYVRAEWDDIQLAVDVCNHITETGTKAIEIQEFETGVDYVQPSRLTSRMLAPLKMGEDITAQLDEETRLINKTPSSEDKPEKKKEDEEEEDDDDDTSSKRYYEYDG